MRYLHIFFKSYTDEDEVAQYLIFLHIKTGACRGGKLLFLFICKLVVEVARTAGELHKMKESCTNTGRVAHLLEYIYINLTLITKESAPVFEKVIA